VKLKVKSTTSSAIAERPRDARVTSIRSFGCSCAVLLHLFWNISFITFCCHSQYYPFIGTYCNAVDKFCYLGDMLEANGGCDSAVTARNSWKKALW